VTEIGLTSSMLTFNPSPAPVAALQVTSWNFLSPKAVTTELSLIPTVAPIRFHHLTRSSLAFKVFT
jgi:hypothetical protein